MVAMELNEKRARARGPNISRKRFVVDDERSGIGIEIERVRKEIIKVCCKNDIETSGRERYKLGENRITESWRASFTQVGYFSLAILGGKEQLVDEAPVRTCWTCGIIAFNDLRSPGIQILAMRRSVIAKTRNPAILDECSCSRNARRNRAARSEEKRETLFRTCFCAQPPYKLFYIDASYRLSSELIFLF